MMATLECPHCQGELHPHLVFKDTTMTVIVECEEGQHPQAETISGMIDSFAKLNKEIAVNMGTTAEVLIVNMVYNLPRIEITFSIMECQASQHDDQPPT
jgi:hypothetical protein